MAIVETCILTYPRKGGGLESIATMRIDDGRMLWNHVVDEDPSAKREDKHQLQLKTLRKTSEWVLAHEAWLADPSSLDRTSYTEGMKSYIRKAPWFNGQ